LMRAATAAGTRSLDPSNRDIFDDAPLAALAVDSDLRNRGLAVGGLDLADLQDLVLVDLAVKPVFDSKLIPLVGVGLHIVPVDHDLALGPLRQSELIRSTQLRVAAPLHPA